MRPPATLVLSADRRSSDDVVAFRSGGIQYTSDSGSLLPHYKETLIPEIKVLIFNGDVDACVPYKGNE